MERDLNKQLLQEEITRISIDSKVNNDIKNDINALSPSIREYVDEGLYLSLSNKEKDELREFSRQLAKNPKQLEFIKKWLLDKRKRTRWVLFYSSLAGNSGIIFILPSSSPHVTSHENTLPELDVQLSMWIFSPFNRRSFSSSVNSCSHQALGNSEM